MLKEQRKCENFPAKKIWIKQVCPRVCFFIWALKGRTLTTNNLGRRGKPMPLGFILCECEEETIPDLFLNCRVTRWIWNKMFRGFGIQLNGDINIRRWFCGRFSERRSRAGDLIQTLLFHVVTWVYGWRKAIASLRIRRNHWKELALIQFSQCESGLNLNQQCGVLRQKILYLIGTPLPCSCFSQLL